MQYDPWGRGHGNPPGFDRQGRMIKHVQTRDENDLVKNHLILTQTKF